MNRSFDENLTDEQRERAQRLRKSIRSDHAPMRRDPPTKGKLERFDDIFDNNSDLSRSGELRRKCKAELYWMKASVEEQKSIRDAIVLEPPYKGNELFTRYFLRRDLKDIITDESVLNYVINNVLALQ